MPNNFKVFDESKQNIMSDEEYASSTQRINGVQAGVASSMLQNKTLRQTSLIAYAISQLMSENGLDASDEADVSAFVSNLSQTILQKVLDKATLNEAAAGEDDYKWISALQARNSITAIAPYVPAILSTATKSMYNLPESGTPDEVFASLKAIPSGKGRLKIWFYEMLNGLNTGVDYVATLGLEARTDTYTPIVSAAGGYYTIDLAPGSKSFSVCTPLGYAVISGTKSVAITAGTYSELNIQLVRDTSLVRRVSISDGANYPVTIARWINTYQTCIAGGGGGGDAVKNMQRTRNCSVATGGCGGEVKNITRTPGSRVFLATVGAGGKGAILNVAVAKIEATKGSASKLVGKDLSSTDIAAGGVPGVSVKSDSLGSYDVALGIQAQLSNLGSGASAFACVYKAGSIISDIDAPKGGENGSAGGNAYSTAYDRVNTWLGSGGQGYSTKEFATGALFSSAGGSAFAYYGNSGSVYSVNGAPGTGGGAGFGVAGDETTTVSAGNGTAPGAGGGAIATASYENRDKIVIAGSGANGQISFKFLS